MTVLRCAAAVATVLFLACSGGAAPEANTVTSVLTDLTLEHINVTVGTTVMWTNEDAQFHTITSGTPEDRGRLWDSGILKRGMSFSFKFQAPGSFDYFCTLHPHALGGTVTVAEAGQ